MKKLLCVAGLIAAVLFTNVADASIGSPMRHGMGYRAPVSIGRHIVRRPMVRRAMVRHAVARHAMVRHAVARRAMVRHAVARRAFHVRPVAHRVSFCTRCAR